MVAALLAPAALVVPVASAATVDDIIVRDQLIANQETLLNVYRCMFDVDTQIVPGGCADGVPIQPPASPAPFTGEPSTAEVAVRDTLVLAQEALLNVYRCMFEVDTQIVPGGCQDSAPIEVELGSDHSATDEEPEPTAQPDLTTYSAMVMRGVLACAIRESGGVVCWGSEGHSVVTDAPTEASYTAVDLVTDESSANLLAVACATRESGGVDCWGDEQYYTIGVLVSNAPTEGNYTNINVEFAGDGESSLSSANSAVACAVGGPGGVDCWGDGIQYIESTAPTDGSYTAVDFALVASQGDGVTYFGSIACALSDVGDIVCWGTSPGVQYGAPTVGAYTYIGVNVGDACALRDTGEVICWGINSLASGAPTEGAYTAMDAFGNYYACATRGSGGIACWGNTHMSKSALMLTGAPDQGEYRAIDVGSGNACAARESGGVACWGTHGFGVITDAPAEGIFNAVEVFRQTACALSNDGKVTCWGSDEHGLVSGVPS